MEHIKKELRNKLNELSKDELVDIIADLCFVHFFASATSGLISNNHVQQCINNVQTDLRKTENLNEQKINESLLKTK